MIGVGKTRSLELHRKVGLRLRARREALGLKRSEVARHCGYTNLSKGARRIAHREQGQIGPLLHEDRYYELLQLDPHQVRAELHDVAALQTRIDALGHDCLAAERALLRTNAELLLAHAETIAADSRWRGVRSPVALLRILWMGGGPVPLGALVQAWQAGALVASSEAFGPIYLFEGSGSALSGAGSCWGVDRTGTARRVSGSPVRFFPRGASGPWRERSAPSAWSLADAVAALGGRAACSHFHLLDAHARPIGDPIARYNPVSGRLALPHTHTQTLDPAALLPHAICEQVEPGGVSVGGGKPQPMTLGALELGGVRSASVVHACGLRLIEGRIEAPGGWLPLKVTGPSPPPAVLPLLSALLKRFQKKEEPSFK